MAVDRGGLLRRELHEVLNLVNGLPSMAAEMIALVYGIERYLLPHTVDLLVSVFRRVEIDLADVMEQRGDGEGFVRNQRRGEEGELLRVVQYVQ